MQDRISNHPNRWKIKDVNTGVETLADLTRADDPTQVGTPLNKATFMPDAVASAVETATGVSGITLPGEALDALATAFTNLGAGTIAHIETGSYTGTGTAGSGGTGTATSLTFGFKPRAVFIVKSGSVVSTTTGDAFMWFDPSTIGGYGTVTNTVSVTDNILSWITNSTTSNVTTRARDQMNTNGQVYNYIAWGVE